jgi:hypothetical protein
MERRQLPSGAYPSLAVHRVLAYNRQMGIHLIREAVASHRAMLMARAL